MITIEQLKDVKTRTEALYRYLDIENKKIQVEEEQLRTQAPGFWDDAKAAEEQMKKVKGLQKWIDGYKEVKTLCDELELVVIKRGQGFVSVDFDKRLVHSGDIIIIPPRCLHAIEQDDTFKMEYENIFFKPDLLSSGANDLCMIQYIVPLLDGSLPIEYFLTPALGSFEALSNCIRQIDLVCADQTPGWQLAVKSSLFNFFFLLISERQKKTVSTSSNSKSLEKMKTVLKYVENHYTEKLTIDDMAELTYYSKSHFMKFFKAHMGIGFTEYLNDYRLTMAARLLKSSDDSILMIADASGFDNLSYFNRIFKRKYGISPGAYRKA